MAKPLAQLLRAARERAGLTQSALAELVDMAPNHIARLESGEKLSPRFETMARLAAALGMSLDRIAVDCGYRPAIKGAPSDVADAARLVHEVRALRDRVQSFGQDLESQLDALERRSGALRVRSRTKR